MTEDKVVSFGKKSRVRAEAEAERRASVDRFRQHLRIVSRAVREMRESGATSQEIAHALRMAAEEVGRSHGEPA